MRVIAGKYRSRVIEAPQGMDTRPTMDMVKQAMFNIIGVSVINATVVDMFSGSGGLGIEAISRGAKKVYFNDHSASAIKVIKKNIETLKIDSSRYEISDYDYKQRILTLKEKVNLLLLDPPYKNKIYAEIIGTFLENNLLTEHAIIVCEADLDQEIINVEGFVSREYKYGSKKLIILKK